LNNRVSYDTFSSKITGVYFERYVPQKIIKLAGHTGFIDDPKALVLPLYFASKWNS
jgi:hypothetical protein